MKKPIFSIGFVILLMVAAWAEVTKIADSHIQRTITLKTKDRLSVLGDDNTLTVHGQGGTLKVMGNHNEFNLEGQIAGPIEIYGNGNNLLIDAEVSKLILTGDSNKIRIIRRLGRNQPSLTRVGQGNEITYEDGK